MSDVRVMCINKETLRNSHTGITHLGCERQRWTRQQAVDSIRSGANTFFMLIGNKRADLGIVSAISGEYLRAYAEGRWNDDLLALPECRA